MHRFANFAFFAVLILVGGAGSSFVVAQDLDELLKDVPAWASLTDGERREIAPVLSVLFREGRPSLDPSKAFDKAREQLRISIQALVKSSESQFENELVDNLTPFSPETGVDSARLNQSRVHLRKVLADLSTNNPKLELYINLAEAIESFTFLAPWEGKSPSDYEELLDELKMALILFASAPRGDDERKELGRIAGLIEAFAEADQAASIDELLSALQELCKKPNLWLHISGRLINDFVNSAVPPINEPQSVNECILGTSVAGTANVCATASVSPRQASDHAAFSVTLKGTATSNTIGYQKPVRIRSKGESSFWAEKCVAISDAYFLSGRASATACTDTTICSIKKVGRQCLSCLIERIAWNRARQQETKAETIASEKLARRVEASFDERLDSALAKARKFYEDRVRNPLRRFGLFPAVLQFGSTCDDVRIGAALGKPDQLGALRDPPESSSGSLESDLTVRIHDTFIRGVFMSEDVPAEVFDRLVKEFVSSLPGVKDSATSQKFDPQLFKAISMAMMQPESDRSRFVKEKLPRSGKLELIDVLYEDGWITIYWRMRNGQ